MTSLTCREELNRGNPRKKELRVEGKLWQKPKSPLDFPWKEQMSPSLGKPV